MSIPETMAQSGRKTPFLPNWIFQMAELNFKSGCAYFISRSTRGLKPASFVESRKGRA